jgi:hypothetical protein
MLRWLWNMRSVLWQPPFGRQVHGAGQDAGNLGGTPHSAVDGTWLLDTMAGCKTPPRALASTAPAQGQTSWSAKVCARALFAAGSAVLFDFSDLAGFITMVLERDSESETQRVLNGPLTTYCCAGSHRTCACGQPERTLYALCKRGVSGVGFQTYVSEILIKAQVESPLSALRGNAPCFYRINVCLTCWKSDFGIEAIEQSLVDALVCKFKSLPANDTFRLAQFNLSAPH